MASYNMAGWLNLIEIHIVNSEAMLPIRMRNETCLPENISIRERPTGKEGLNIAKELASFRAHYMAKVQSQVRVQEG